MDTNKIRGKADDIIESAEEIKKELEPEEELEEEEEPTRVRGDPIVDIKW